MAISSVREKYYFEISKEPFVRDNSPNGVALYKMWEKSHPKCVTMKYEDLNGVNALQAAYSYGNVALVKYILEQLASSDKEILNYLNGKNGLTIFSEVISVLNKVGEAERPLVDNIVKCTELIIEAGADVNTKGRNNQNFICYLSDYLNYLETSQRYEEIRHKEQADSSHRVTLEKIAPYATPLIKLHIQKGAVYKCEAFSHFYEQDKWIIEAEQAIARDNAKWPKLRLLWIAHKDQEAIFSILPKELIEYIHDWSDFYLSEKS